MSDEKNEFPANDHGESDRASDLNNPEVRSLQRWTILCHFPVVLWRVANATTSRDYQSLVTGFTPPSARMYAPPNALRKLPFRASVVNTAAG